MARRINIGGLPVVVETMEECEKADFRMCSDTRYFPDDIEAKCSACRKSVYLRPYGPFKPPKLCIQCAVMMHQAEAMN